MTDSGSFRFPSVTAHTHEVIATLMKGDVQPYKVHEAVFDTNTFDKLRLRSYAINEKMEIIDEHKTAITWLNKARSEEHTSELQSRPHLVCRLLLEKKKKKK